MCIFIMSIINPYTGRRIKVGGAVFNKLQRGGGAPARPSPSHDLPQISMNADDMVMPIIASGLSVQDYTEAQKTILVNALVLHDIEAGIDWQEIAESLDVEANDAHDFYTVLVFINPWLVEELVWPWSLLDED
jgi:hypothetical protein